MSTSILGTWNVWWYSVYVSPCESTSPYLSEMSKYHTHYQNLRINWSSFLEYQELRLKELFQTVRFWYGCFLSNKPCPCWKVAFPLSFWSLVSFRAITKTSVCTTNIISLWRRILKHFYSLADLTAPGLNQHESTHSWQIINELLAAFFCR